VNVITPANASIFPEYIIPNIHPLVHDPEVSVRSLYAQCIVPLADAAVRYLEMGQALKAHGTFKVAADAVEYDPKYEVSPVIVESLANSPDVIRCRMTQPYKTCRTRSKNIL
jgi:phosphoinositide-3-kinase, regulatory subunit 4